MKLTPQGQLLVWGMVAASAMLVLFPGCTAMPDAWAEHATKKPLPAVVMRLSPAEVASVCGPRTMGCAKRDYVNGVCVVYTEHKPLPETIPHEMLHCAGFEH